MQLPKDEIKMGIDVYIPGYVPPAVPPTPEERQAELDRIAVEYLASIRKKDSVNRYEAYCPKEYRQFDLNHPKAVENRANIDTILNWKFQKKGLFITGPSGRCKTRSVWALCRKLAYDDGIDFRHYHASDWLSALHECVKYGRDDAKGWISDLAWRPVVIIDDWGQEANLKAREDWAQAWFFRFLDLRIERGLPLIMTTNLTGKDIAERTDSIRSDPLIRRLLETMDIVNFAPKKE